MKKTCTVSGKEFEITDDDLKFYEKMGVPAPSLCPEERQRRRLSWRNERNLYRRKCDFTGKMMISVFTENAPFVVYDVHTWYSDNWDAKSYARDFNFSRPFFEQFAELLSEVPQLSRSVVENQNCEYINQGGWNKDCYLLFDADHNNSCLYGEHVEDSVSCSDCSYIFNSELCFEIIDCLKCYNLKYSQDCKSCSDSWFLKNCIGCKNCFGSVNLQNKEYYFLNKKYSKEEYNEKLKEIDLQNFDELQGMREQFSKLIKDFPQKYMQGIQNENSTGNYMNQTKNCKQCFDILNCQDCKFVTSFRNGKSIYDSNVFGAQKGAEFCYENHEIGDSVQNVCFSDQVLSGCYDIMYSKLCMHNCHDLFGCIGLQRASYCIFNKQYSKEEYFVLRDKIIEHMKKSNEFGEFFPIELSPFAYNETTAQEFFPLTKEEVLEKNYNWKIEEIKAKYEGPMYKIPENIKDVPDDICEKILTCEITGKNYRIVKPELEFYKKTELPIPRICPDERHNRRIALRNPQKLWNRKCDNCEQEISTTFAPDRPEKVFCEKCYLEALD